MKKYAILMVLAAMLCGTEAMAASISYKTFNDEVAVASSDNIPVTNVFQTFLSPTALQVDKVVISISDVGDSTGFYIDNIKFTADLPGGGTGPLQTIGFDGSDGGEFGDPFLGILVVPVPGVTDAVFLIEGLNYTWAVGTPGNPGNSIFVTPNNSAVAAQLVITRREPGQDSGASFFFQSADLKFGTSQTDPNGGNVPEPASLLLLGAGLAGIGIWRRKARG